MSAHHTLNRESVTSLDKGQQLCNTQRPKLEVRFDKRLLKDALASLLDEAGFPDKAASVRRCHKKFALLGCDRGHRHKLVPTHRCGHPCCPYCASKRQRRAYARLMPRLMGLTRQHPYDRWVFITLTVPSSRERLAVHHARVKGAFRRLRRSRRWKNKVRGGVAGFEFTHKQRHGWHYHIHALVLRKAYYTGADLAADWARVMGVPVAFVKINEVDDLGAALAETLKYCFKPSDIFGMKKDNESWTHKQMAEFEELRGSRFGETFGELYGLKIETDEDSSEEDELFEGSPCPDCGLPLHSLMMTHEELEIPLYSDDRPQDSS